jgi:hypothetical protein
LYVELEEEKVDGSLQNEPGEELKESLRKSLGNVGLKHLVLQPAISGIVVTCLGVCIGIQKPESLSRLNMDVCISREYDALFYPRNVKNNNWMYCRDSWHLWELLTQPCLLSNLLCPVQ